jgi:hypothetical protein
MSKASCDVKRVWKVSDRWSVEKVTEAGEGVGEAVKLCQRSI